MKAKSESGQAMLEGVIVIFLLAMVSFGIIECVRVFAFKSLLQNAANEVATQIAVNSLFIQRNNPNPLSPQGSQAEKTFRQELNIAAKAKIQNFLSNFPTGPHRAPLLVSITFQQPHLPDGVYVHVDSCVNLFFLQKSQLEKGRLETTAYQNDGFSTKFDEGVQENIDLDPTLNCLGRFDPDNPKGLSVKVIGYMPWPMAHKTYHKGLYENKVFPGFDSGVPEGIQSVIDSVSSVLSAVVPVHDITEQAEDNSRTRVETSVVKTDFFPKALLR